MLIDKIIMIVDVFLCKIIRPTVLIPAMASKEFGNEKKPRRLPMNFMGTIILILSISIVGPMWLMSLKDASHGAQTVHANNFFRDKIDELEIKFVSQGRPIDFKLLPEPLFVTFGNEGFQDLLANFVCNLLSFNSMLKHTLIIVTSQKTASVIESLNTDVTVGLIPDTTLQRGYDYNTKDYLNLMFLRGQCLLKILGEKEIIWLEADARYYKNLLNETTITETRSDFVFFRDQFMFGGGFIRFARKQTAKEFYSVVMSRLNESAFPQLLLSRTIRFWERLKGAFTSPSQAPFYERFHRAILSQVNDQFILNTYLNEEDFNYTVFDACRFRSGYYYHSWIYQLICSGIEPVMQQHNWMVGVQTKISFAKSNDGWFLNPNDPSKCLTK